MLEATTDRLKLWHLHFNEWKHHRFYKKVIREATDAARREELEFEDYAEYTANIELGLSLLRTRRARRLARRYDLALPTYPLAGEETDDWETAINRRWVLSDMAYAKHLAQVRDVKKYRRDAIGFWLKIASLFGGGVVGSIISFARAC